MWHVASKHKITKSNLLISSFTDRRRKKDEARHLPEVIPASPVEIAQNDEADGDSLGDPYAPMTPPNISLQLYHFPCLL